MNTIKEPRKIYECLFVDGLKNGIGIEYSRTGKILYQGEFWEDKYHGLGVLNYPGGHIKFQGEFKGGYKNGFGWVYDLEGEIF